MMIVIAYLAAAFAFPWASLMVVGGLAMLVGSIVLATILASPALLLSWLIERRKHRRGVLIPDRRKTVPPDQTLQNGDG